MTFLTPMRRWTPQDPMNWTRRAYGRQVMFESTGGTLVTSVSQNGTDAQIYLRAKVRGRMLVEIYCNGQQILSELSANEEIDLFVDIERFAAEAGAQVELHFIPATNGNISISREVEVIAKGGAIFSMEKPGRPSPVDPAPVVEFGVETPSALSKFKTIF